MYLYEHAVVNIKLPIILKTDGKTVTARFSIYLINLQMSTHFSDYQLDTFGFLSEGKI